MSLLVWKDEYALGHADVDQDHRQVLAMINALNDSVSTADSQAVDDAVGDILAYVDRHFDREEALMDKAGYNRLAEHRNEHRRLAAEFARLRADYDAGRTAALGTKLLMFMASWWVKHILAWDIELVPLLRARA